MAKNTLTHAHIRTCTHTHKYTQTTVNLGEVLAYSGKDPKHDGSEVAT